MCEFNQNPRSRPILAKRKQRICHGIEDGMEADMLKLRSKNFGLGFGLVTSGLGTLWPRPEVCGLGGGLKL